MEVWSINAFAQALITIESIGGGCVYYIVEGCSAEGKIDDLACIPSFSSHNIPTTKNQWHYFEREANIKTNNNDLDKVKIQLFCHTTAADKIIFMPVSVQTPTFTFFFADMVCTVKNR